MDFILNENLLINQNVENWAHLHKSMNLKFGHQNIALIEVRCLTRIRAYIEVNNRSIYGPPLGSNDIRDHRLRLN